MKTQNGELQTHHTGEQIYRTILKKLYEVRAKGEKRIHSLRYCKECEKAILVPNEPNGIQCDKCGKKFVLPTPPPTVEPAAKNKSTENVGIVIGDLVAKLKEYCDSPSPFDDRYAYEDGVHDAKREVEKIISRFDKPPVNDMAGLIPRLWAFCKELNAAKCYGLEGILTKILYTYEKSDTPAKDKPTPDKTDGTGEGKKK